MPTDTAVVDVTDPEHRSLAELEVLLGGRHRLGGGVIPADEAPEDAEERRAAYEWLAAVDTRFLACRNKHAFPKLVVTRAGKLPRGIDADPLPGGQYAITQTCRDCRLPRHFVVTGDIFAPERHYDYDYDACPGYRMPHNATRYVTTADINRELWRRFREAIDAKAAAR
jgi:hypothetical protein